MRTRSSRIHDVVLALLSLGSAALVAWTVRHGMRYYTLPLGVRPRLDGHSTFRAAGHVGHGLGILGSVMIVLLLLYSLRKRVPGLRRAGELRTWLRYHIFLGVAGPVLITFHTAFKVGGLVAVSYWSMVAVALSGFFGRYLYQQLPRNVLGEQVAVAEIEARNEALLLQLAEAHHMDDRAASILEDIALKRLQRRSAPVALLLLPFANAVLARQLQRWSLRYVDGDRAAAARLAKEWALHARRLHLFHLVRDLFHYWHVFHKPFAFIMILVMIVHVAVAVSIGYTWSF